MRQAGRGSSAAERLYHLTHYSFNGRVGDAQLAIGNITCRKRQTQAAERGCVTGRPDQAGNLMIGRHQPAHHIRANRPRPPGYEYFRSYLSLCGSRVLPGITLRAIGVRR